MTGSVRHRAGSALMYRYVLFAPVLIPGMKPSALLMELYVVVVLKFACLWSHKYLLQQRKSCSSILKLYATGNKHQVLVLYYLHRNE